MVAAVSTPSGSPPADLDVMFWRWYTDGTGQWNVRRGRRPEGPSGADLAALRRGLGRQPGSVPAMWPFYVCINPHGDETPEYVAEHAALTLYAVHQQSQARPMHRCGIGLGTAMLQLRHERNRPSRNDESGAPAASATNEADTVREDWTRIGAVDRRFNAAATATDRTELVAHLRGLVTQLRGIAQPLDYDLLFADLRGWSDPHSVAVTRRQWGMQYFTRTRPTDSPNNEAPTPVAIS